MAYIPEDAQWYLACIVIEICIEHEPRNVVHINTTLIQANSPEAAFEQAEQLGRAGDMVYENSDGKRVEIRYRGLKDVLVIHDDLEHGAELLYEEYIGISEEKIHSWLTAKTALSVFAPRAANLSSKPNYMPASVMQSLTAQGFTSADLDP